MKVKLLKGKDELNYKDTILRVEEKKITMSFLNSKLVKVKISVNPIFLNCLTPYYFTEIPPEEAVLMEEFYE